MELAPSHEIQGRLQTACLHDWDDRRVKDQERFGLMNTHAHTKAHIRIHTCCILTFSHMHTRMCGGTNVAGMQLACGNNI